MGNDDFASRPPLVDLFGFTLCLILMYWLSRSLSRTRTFAEYCRSSRVYYVPRRRGRRPAQQRDAEVEAPILGGGAAAV